MSWFVYIIGCSDKKLYTGITNNLVKRIEAHNRGGGCRFTRCRNPVSLLHSEKFQTRSEALKREFAIKQLRRQEKLVLIES